jgi:hypothetical protein
MESTPASTKTALTRVVLHLDLEEDVDNGVGLFNLGVLERIVWFKVCASAFAGYTFFPAHSSPRVVYGESSVHAAQIQRGQNKEEA